MGRVVGYFVLGVLVKPLLRNGVSDFISDLLGTIRAEQRKRDLLYSKTHGAVKPCVLL